jgi:hypothetical protein
MPRETFHVVFHEYFGRRFVRLAPRKSLAYNGQDIYGRDIYDGLEDDDDCGVERGAWSEAWIDGDANRTMTIHRGVYSITDPTDVPNEGRSFNVVAILASSPCLQAAGTISFTLSSLLAGCCDCIRLAHGSGSSWTPLL